jgi:hypothetical protein
VAQGYLAGPVAVIKQEMMIDGLMTDMMATHSQALPSCELASGYTASSTNAYVTQGWVQQQGALYVRLPMFVMIHVVLCHLSCVLLQDTVPVELCWVCDSSLLTSSGCSCWS